MGADFILWLGDYVTGSFQASLQRMVNTALLSELSFDVGNQILPLLVHLVLGVEKRAALLVAVGFEGFEGEEIIA
jgi:hypothetical protein